MTPTAAAPIRHIVSRCGSVSSGTPNNAVAGTTARVVSGG